MPSGIIVDDLDRNGNMEVDDLKGNSIILIADTGADIVMKGFSRQKSETKMLTECIMVLSSELIKHMSRKDFIRFQNELLLKLGV